MAVIPSDGARRHGNAALTALAGFARSSDRLSIIGKIAILALLYAMLGWFGLMLAAPPGYASLVWPASGLAVAALLMGGRNLWPGVYLGAFTVNLALGNAFDGSSDTLAAIAIAAMIALGSTAQALVAATAIRRWFGYPIAFEKPSDILKFIVIIGPASCLIAASVGVTVLWLFGGVPSQSIVQIWLDWWRGDLLGIIVILPIALFARWKEPKLIWRGNSITPLTGSMAIVLLLLMGATLWAWRVASELTHERNLAAFSQMASDSELALSNRVQSYLQSLDGAAAVFAVSDQVSHSDWKSFVDAIDIEKLPGINGVGYIQQVSAEDEAEFLQEARADGRQGFEIQPSSDRSQKYVIKYIEPEAINLQAIGLDIAFESNRRWAAVRSRDSGHAVITKRIFLVQDSAKTPGFLLLRPVYTKNMPLNSVSERRKAFKGWVYAPFIASRFVGSLTASQDNSFTFDIFDGRQAEKGTEIFNGNSGTENAAFVIQNTIPILDHEWTIVWESTPELERKVQTGEPLLVLIGGIALTLLFGVLLLAYVRRAAYIAEQVEAKTRKLKQAMEALDQSERRYGDLSGLSPAGIFQTDPYGFSIYVNDSWLEMCGLQSYSALGIGWISAIHQEDRDAFYNAWLKALDQQIELRATFRIAHANGEDRWIDMISKPQFSAAKLLRGFIVVAMDVTKHKELECALEQAVEVKSRFLADMSHEIRTPMNGVIGYTQLLLKGELTDEQHRQVQLIADSGRAMMRLLNDILDLSKVDSGLMKITSEPVDLRHVANGCVTLTKSIALEKLLDLECDIDPSVPQCIQGDALRLRQILLNLLGNALKFTDKGHVTLRIRMDETQKDLLIIEVEDSGVGIAPERQAEIFGAFVQVEDTGSRGLGGTGLGLAISSKLAELMGGTLVLESTLGKGSVFRLFLPIIVIEQAKTIAADSKRLPELRREAQVLRCNKILLVEDHDINQMLMTDMLNNLGIAVEIAENGEEAVARVRQSDASSPAYDLVLMDVRMPVMNGLDATRAIRAAGYDADHLPIVALTANGFADDIAACLESGMQSHLTKPINLIELEEAIAKWARTPSDRVAPDAIGKTRPQAKQSLQERFTDRKQQGIEKLAEFVRRGTYSQAEVSEICDILHKLAGTAGMFGEAELGEQFRAIENALENWVAEKQTGQISKALEELQKAA